MKVSSVIVRNCVSETDLGNQASLLDSQIQPPAQKQLGIPAIAIATAIISSACFTLGNADPSQALTLVTSRSVLAGNDRVQWQTLGSEFTPVPNFFAAPSASKDITVKGNIPAGSFEVWKQVQSNVLADLPGWHGNFAAGDGLLFTNFNPGPLTLDLVPLSGGTGVIGVGTQIQPNLYSAFSATIRAFDASANLLGNFTLAGVSTADADNSALFLGVLSDRPNISRIELSLASTALGNAGGPFLGEFAINQLDLKTGKLSAQGTPVPTPALLPGLIGLGLRLLRFKKS